MTLIAVLLLAVAGGAVADTYVGELSTLTDPKGIISTGQAWDGTGGWGTISWVVTEVNPTNWHYSYTFTVPNGGVSHFILQVSTSLTSPELISLDDPASVAMYGPAYYYPPPDDGSSNLGLPEAFYGIKFEPVGSPTTFTVGFSVARDPVWGDFYARDGQAPLPGGETTHTLNAAWNAGFTSPDADPETPPISGSVDYHLLVPDTTNGPGGPEVVPELNAAVFLITGLAGVFGFAARRRVQGK